jgi:hypothetical protein
MYFCLTGLEGLEDSTLCKQYDEVKFTTPEDGHWERFVNDDEMLHFTNQALKQFTGPLENYKARSGCPIEGDVLGEISAVE